MGSFGEQISILLSEILFLLVWAFQKSSLPLEQVKILGINREAWIMEKVKNKINLHTNAYLG